MTYIKIMTKAITSRSKHYRKERTQSAQVRNFKVAGLVCFPGNLFLALSNAGNTKGFGRTTCPHTAGNERKQDHRCIQSCQAVCNDVVWHVFVVSVLWYIFFVRPPS